jgi:hypothetical protein
MSRLRQLTSALLILGTITSLVVGLWAGRFLPGKAGEFFARFFHLITTPIILEISFAALGIFIVIALAHHHEKNADEWVEMDIPDEPEQQKSNK